MLPIPDDASTLLCSTEIKRRELTYYVVAGAVGLVTLPGNGSSNAAASLDHMYVFALGEFGSPQSSVAIGILHFRDHWTGIIAPCSGLTTSHSSLFPLLFFHYFCIGDSSPEIHDLLNITHMHQRFKLKSCKFCSEDKEPAQPAIVNRFIKNRYSIYI